MTLMTSVRVPLLLIFAGLFLAGCESMPESVAWRVEPQTNYYARPRPQVLEALVAVLERQGYAITKQRAATGVVEAQGSVLESGVWGKPRQYFVSAKLRDLGDGETSVALMVHEAQEGDFAVGATTKALANHGRYASIFGALEEELGEGSWLPPRATSRPER